jgi:hypothetical protein
VGEDEELDEFVLSEYLWRKIGKEYNEWEVNENK